MTSSRKTRRKIDDIVVSQADDPSAWEHEAVVNKVLGVVVGSLASLGKKRSIPRPAPIPLEVRLLADTAEWPKRWLGVPSDLPLARAALAAMLPFLESIASQSLSETSLRRHFGNASLLGDEIVRSTFLTPSVGKLRGTKLLLHFLDDEGGPLLHGHATEADQRSFDATCRKVFFFLTGQDA